MIPLLYFITGSHYCIFPDWDSVPDDFPPDAVRTNWEALSQSMSRLDRIRAKRYLKRLPQPLYIVRPS